MTIGNYGTSLKKCCEDMFSDIEYDDFLEDDELRKGKFRTCKECSTVVWYDQKVVQVSSSDDEPFVDRKLLVVRTNV